MVTRTLLAALVAATAPACSYGATFRDCVIQCVDSTGCPGDFECTEGLCRAAGEPMSCESILGDARGVQFSSCDGLAATCGPDTNDNCCSTAMTIPGGTFYRGHDVATDGMYPDMSYPAEVSPFVLDKYEVTVGRFRRFVEAGRGTQTSPPATGAGARTFSGVAGQGGWEASWNTLLAVDKTRLLLEVKCDPTSQTWTEAPGANENKPMNCITWYEAMAFCIWDGGYLPTEAEWNFAASGGNAHRAYPWSSPPASTAITCSHANYQQAGGNPCVTGPATYPVGTKSPMGDGKYEQSDLAGNVREWTLDWSAPQYGIPCSDCAYLTVTTDRRHRGGDFVGVAETLRGASRKENPPGTRNKGLGLRCARPVL